MVDVLDKASATPEQVMRLATPGTKEATRHVAI
jgi:hypothetical protein